MNEVKCRSLFQNPSLAIALGATLASFAAGCVNSRLSGVGSKLLVAVTPAPSSTININGDYFKIGNVSIASSNGASGGAAGGGTDAQPVTTIFIDPSQSRPAGASTATAATAPLLNKSCTISNSGAGAKDCVCRFTWNESNDSTGTNVSFARSVDTPLTNVQGALATCLAPQAYLTDIEDGTSIKISIQPTGGNTSQFYTSEYKYLKNGSQLAGSFRDAEGHSFDNVRHYACYEQFKRGSALQSFIATATDQTNGEQMAYPVANKFCVQKDGAAPGAGCTKLPSVTSNSAQAYYYNFYVRATESGDVNQWNDRFACPIVKESLSNPSGSAGGQGSPWPMDTTFSLSLGKTPDFNIGVTAFVELANGTGDPVSKNSKACDGTAIAGNDNGSGFVQGCLGFAAKPNTDGSCPYFRDSSGQIRLTYRLRRFIALYPHVFEPSGATPTNTQPTDTIYVLDRPVSGSADVLKPYTMRGPKPCPFSLYDAKGVTGYVDNAYGAYGNVLPIYAATNNPNWNGTNVDGTQFPNTDSVNSCSAAMVLPKIDEFNPDIATLSLGTVNLRNPKLKRLYVRPIHAWAPHFEEDTEFQACAPQAAPFKDPPLHFAKDPTNGNVAWCAESYPSQNDHIPSVDLLQNPNSPLSATNPYIGHVRPFTSHVAKQSASAPCVATIPATIPTPVAGQQRYPTTGLARHQNNSVADTAKAYAPMYTPVPVYDNNTCDRTAIAQGGGVEWPHFPLLASPYFVEAAISSDTTYGCVITYDGGGGKKGKKTPTGGCCGNSVHLNTGLAVQTNTAATKELKNMNAHLEPDVACLAPSY
jgi:hypothetical protein